LKTTKAAATEELISLIDGGNKILLWIRDDYQAKTRDEKILHSVEIEREYDRRGDQWLEQVQAVLNSIFPTTTEANIFKLTSVPSPQSITSERKLQYSYPYLRLEEYRNTLQNILETKLPIYTDLTGQYQISVDDIDSFSKVVTVEPATVAKFLIDGRLEMLEEEIQRAFEDILGEFYHQKDSASEINDLYTTNVKINNVRVPTAFLLKGRGLRDKVLDIHNCGDKGTQLVRLLESPAELFIVQFIGEISQYVIKDVLGKVNEKRLRGERAWFCIMNGQDTARILLAYNKL